ncbi:MAG: hypothetical protein CNE98_05650 [Bacteroidetes bacterium MED-G17]|nr:MAG: hypothetical protein CNE98_05650 [Bacteroidetes bacterium MED-G17]
MKKHVIGLLHVFLFFFSSAQTELIGYQLSQPSWSGSPRAMGAGDAFGALGADIASAQINPAGLAQFKKSEYSFSLGYKSQKNTSTYFNNSKVDNSSDLYLSNLSMVFSQKKRRKTGWQNFNLGLSYNQNNNFQRKIRYEGINNESSYTEAVAELANVIGIATGDSLNGLQNGFDEYADMFWFAYLIDPHPSGEGGYIGTIDPNYRRLEQRNTLNQSGKNSQFNISFSGNFDNQILFGAGLGLFTSNFDETNQFTELNDFDLKSQNTWDLFDFRRSFSYQAAGFGLNLGLIVLPFENVRAGLSLQTPKFMTINENFSDRLNVQYFMQSARNYFTKDFSNNYRLTTPAKTTLSFAYLFDKKGFLSADIEMIDYSTMSFSSSDQNLDAVNDFLTNNFRSTVNVRFGGEYVLNKIQLRGGYGRLQSPNKKTNSTTEGTDNFTIGVGLKDRRTSIEIAYLYQIVRDAYSPYSTANQRPFTVNKTTNKNLVLGMKFRF